MLSIAKVLIYQYLYTTIEASLTMGLELFYSRGISDGERTLDREESNHCVRVLRHRAGDDIHVIDGAGFLYVCTIVDDNPKEVIFEVKECIEGYGTHPYWLNIAVAPPKNIDRFEWFSEKATEIGVDEITPLFGEYSERKVFKTDRLRRVVLSAVKQSLKAALPEVSSPLSVKDYITSAPQDALRLICYCDSSLPRERRLNIKDVLSSSETKICILIGPEGDFSSEEVDLALNCGWKPVQLGDSRLRTETAALVAVAAVYFRPV